MNVKSPIVEIYSCRYDSANSGFHCSIESLLGSSFDSPRKHLINQPTSFFYGPFYPSLLPSPFRWWSFSKKQAQFMGQSIVPRFDFGSIDSG